MVYAVTAGCACDSVMIRIDMRTMAMGTKISFNRPDGKKIDGYLAEPAHAADAPGIGVIQEWWGVNEQIRGVAERLATAAYRPLAPSLFPRKSPFAPEEAHHRMTALNF